VTWFGLGMMIELSGEWKQREFWYD